MGWFRKNYYVWNEQTKKVDVLSGVEFDIFMYELKRPVIKLEVKENQSESILYIKQLEDKCKSLSEILLKYDRSIGVTNSSKPYEYVAPKEKSIGVSFDREKIHDFSKHFESFDKALTSKYLNIYFNNINDIKVVANKQPTKEEVFQIIEKLLTIETID